MSNLSTQSAVRIGLVNTYLDAFFNRKILAARDIHPRYETLWHEIVRVSGYGKRLRPQMVLLAYESFGGTDVSEAVPAAAACELLHVSMLIHDDIIDRDLIRHGEPTIQAAYETRYNGEVKNSRDRRHNAISAAILAGDLLLSEARGLIAKTDAPLERTRQAGHAFDQSVFEVAGGELLDVESAGAQRGSVSAMTIMQYKTASYSFIGPLTIGSILAGASRAQQSSIKAFALNLGIAYQLTDDILGIFGNTSETGKPNDGDIREGKATYLVERFYALAPAGDVTKFESIYGNASADAADCEIIRNLLTSHGALSETERSVRFHTDRARAHLLELNLTQNALLGYETLISLCTERTS